MREVPVDRFEDSFEQLFARSYRVALRIVFEPAEAEDVAAEALSRAYLAWRRLRDADHREAWVLRVTTNLAIDVLRKRARAAPEPRPALSAHLPGELSAVLVPVLRKLPRRQREVVVLRHLVDLPEAEVARVLGISTGSVKQHLQRGLSSLRGQLPPDTLEDIGR
jgi:RNA polymerase sigma-70 factor (ECF subfamily)